MAHSIEIPTRDADIGRNSGRPIPPKRPILLTVQQAADFASISQQTVRRWIKAGHLKVYRAGRQIRIDEADLIANVTQQELTW
jgi:excisionase family DNA binding protein